MADLPLGAAWRRSWLWPRLALAALLLSPGVAPALERIGEAGLRVALQLEPPILDPTAGAAAPINEIVHGNLFEGLLGMGEDGEPRPRLALDWDVAPDGLSYHFRLRPGVRFHDGTPFDAEVARFALERARAPGSLNPQRAALDAIARIEVLDPLRLRLVLKRRAGGLLQTLASGALVMVAPASADGNKTAPVGTGPFRFAAWRRGEAVELRRHEGYWGGPAALDWLRYRFIADPSAAYAALMAGDVDLFSNFPAPENLAQFKADPRFVVSAGSSEGETLLVFNQRRAPLDQRLVRRALSHAIDRRALIDGAMFGYGIPIGSHFPPGHAAYVDLTAASAHDPERARALLAEAGLAQGFALQLKLPPTPYARRGGEIIAAQLARVGVRVQLQNLEWSQWMDQVFTRHDFDLSLVVHAEPQDYDIYGRDDYYFGYRSPAFKSLLAQLDEHSDSASRRELLQALQRQLSDDAANGFLFQYPRLLVRKTGLQGLRFNASGSIELGAAQWEASAAASARGPAGGPGSAWREPLANALLAALALGAALLALGLLRRAGVGWLLRRLPSLLLTLALSSALVFALVQLAPGDPARYMLGLNAEDQAVAALREQLGLAAPALQRYGQWLTGLLGGDFGQSYTYRVPVGELVRERLQVSLPLTGYALALALMLALPVGLMAAHARGGRLDALLSGLTQLGIALPSFWLGLLLVLVFAVGLRWVPAGGFAGWDQGLWPGLASLTLPALALALPQAAILARVLRGALIEVLHEDYLRTARAKGVGAWRALWRHALPNALIPVLTVLGMQCAFLLAGAVIIENLFFLPGLGRLLFQGVVQRDLILVQGVVMLLVAAVVLVSFVVELAYRAADPRLASQGGRP